MILSRENTKIMKRINCNIKCPQILSEVFNYEDFQNGIKEWNRNELLFEMDIRVCPYCNRQYITKYKETIINEEDTTS
mgnify:CR=1 FL=1